MEKKKSSPFLWALIILIILLVMEWESTKKAIRDAWKGSFHPPVEQVEK